MTLTQPSMMCRMALMLRFLSFTLWASAAFLIIPHGVSSAHARSVNIGILIASDVRLHPVKGLKDELAEHAPKENITFVYKEFNANGNRNLLTDLAAKIIADKPDIAIAGGGIEADALLAASKGSGIPVVFLSVSSAVTRGLVADMGSSGNNLTGIDTNDTQLTGKRVWFIRKMLPQAKKILCFHVPSIIPSGKSVEVAQQAAKELGFSIVVVEVEFQEDIEKEVASLTETSADVILQLPAAPTDKALRPIIFPKALALKIPIFGYGNISIEKGAFASYAGSRYENGRQAARLVHKILNGTKPSDIPVETPEKLEFIINKNLVDKLGIKLPSRVWRMADQIVDIQF